MSPTWPFIKVNEGKKNRGRKGKKKRETITKGLADSHGFSYGPMPSRKTALCMPPVHQEQVQMEKSILLVASSLLLPALDRTP